MRILYGVQGTGNGHITRARMMAQQLSAYHVEVDYLFSGRDEAYFNMECFGDYRRYAGLTFIARNGQIEYGRTLRRNNLIQFWRDSQQLDIQGYDLVITDFEPISAWAAKRAAVPSIGISHQNAFRFAVPMRGANLLTRQLIRHFAPADKYLGLHWHHYGYPILPPMINTQLQTVPSDTHKILVYLPFLPQQSLYPLLRQFPDYQFVQYHRVDEPEQYDNIHCKPLSRSGFQQDFSDCAGLLSNAGFGACSEAIHYGKKLLTIPVQGQFEQLSNALALQQLGYASVSKAPGFGEMQQWLQQSARPAVQFPDVAQWIVQWIIGGRKKPLAEFTAEVWKAVRYRT